MNLLLAQGRYWRGTLAKGTVVLETLKASLPENVEVADFRLEVPLEKWNRLVKNLNSDRKLLGGILLDLAKQKDRVSQVVAEDRLVSELQRIVLDATATLVEQEALVLSAPGENEE